MSDEIETDATTFWEGRYGERDQIWSGNANRALVDVIGTLGVVPGRALDLGSGEGGDSIWLAEQGWHVTGVDISATALGRAEAHASGCGVADRIEWVRADLAEWMPPAGFDLVSACFLHSPVTFPREEVLQRAAAAVTPGGHLLVVGHAGVPPWSRDAPSTDSAAPTASAGRDRAHDKDAFGKPGGHGHARAHAADAHVADSPGAARGQAHDALPTAAQVLAALDLPAREWDTLIAGNQARETAGPDSQRAVLVDAILLLRRR